MPFDGLGFNGLGSAATTAKPSIWARLTQFALGAPPVTKAIPLHAFQPIPADQPDAVTVQVLTIGRALIEDRKDWVQRRYETRDGRRCAVGPQSGATTMLLAVAMSRGFNDIESMNDNSSHRQVLSAFDEAITRARQYSG
jgi:hypothetical protein